MSKRQAAALSVWDILVAGKIVLRLFGCRVNDAAANMIGCYPDSVPASLMKAAQAIKHEVTRDPVKQVVFARHTFFQCKPWGPVQARTLHIPFGHADFPSRSISLSRLDLIKTP